jgi:hypothetical protein
MLPRESSRQVHTMVEKLILKKIRKVLSPDMQEKKRKRDSRFFLSLDFFYLLIGTSWKRFDG